MCGICGIVTADRTTPDERLLGQMASALWHRGPDDSGISVGPGYGLASRRLSILDLTARGRMPMATPDRRFLIVHNGEVYNYLDLRRELQSLGYQFQSRTDTEVLLYLFAEHGPQMLTRLNGMFAFAIWDAKGQSLFLARDRLGIKPLYFHHARETGTLVFASEPKALFEAGVPCNVDWNCLEELICFRFVAGSKTPFEGIFRLLPGHYLEWHAGELKTERWWGLEEEVERRAVSRCGEKLETWFRETFDRSVRDRLLSDVPVGVLLSGGLDSTAVAVTAASQRGSESFDVFTVGFAGEAFDEAALAKRTAKVHDLRIHVIDISPESVGELFRESTRFNDEPLAHGSEPHLLAISRLARNVVKVLLSGEGGDETLGGYVRYQPLRFWRVLEAGRPLVNVLPSVPRAGRRWKKLMRFLQDCDLEGFVLYNACDVLPTDLEEVGFSPRREFPYRYERLSVAQRLYPYEPMRQAMFLDQSTFLCSLLDRNDKMTMGASIECRVPFLYHELVGGLAGSPSADLLVGLKGKPLLRKALRDRLPGHVRRHKKIGFAVPWRKYFQRDALLRSILRALPRGQLVRSGALESGRVREMVNRYLEGDERHAGLIRQLVLIELWLDEVVARWSGRGGEATGRLRAASR